MEIVINRCYGGFGLSNHGVYELIKNNSRFIEVIDSDKFGSKIIEGFIENFNLEFKNHSFFEEMLLNCSNNKIYQLSLTHKYTNIFRIDKDLIDLVKSLKEKSFGKYAKLEIVEIPNNVNWEICEYDGYERIEEIHRVW